jgi:DNA-binding response OmpR family regulator
MPRILVIDDDPSLLDMLDLALSDEGHDVLRAADGVEGMQRAGRDQPDLILCDVNLPGVDGFTLARRLRAAGDTVPLILLTSRDSEIDEALGLELGADDYVTKPCSARVLCARIAALLRREALRGSGAPASPTLRQGQLEMDSERLSLRWSSAEVRVTVTEFRMVEAMARRPGVVYSREQLLERMRGDDSVVADRLVDTYVRRLRRKLEEVDASFDHIETVVGAGYRWRG